MNDVYKKSKKYADVLEAKKDDYNQYIDDKPNIITDTTTIDTSTQSLNFGDGSIVDRRGQYMRDSDSALGQMRILGDRIVFTQDNWDTISVGISSSGIVTNSLFTITNTGGTVEINDNSIDITDMNLDLQTSDGLSRILIDASVGIKLQQSDSLGGWIDTIYLNGTTGSPVFAGDIITSSNAYIGNNLYIGTPASFADKGLYFYDSTTGVYTSIGIFLNEYDTDVYELLISNQDNKINIYSSDTIFIGDEGTMNYLVILPTEGYFTLASGGDLPSSVSHFGSGNLWIQHTGTGVLKIESANNMSIESLGGEVFADGTWRFSSNFYHGTAIDANKILTQLEIETLIGTYDYATESWVTTNFSAAGHTHSYATSGDITAAINAHVTAYH
jgi:hypothetical protein